MLIAAAVVAFLIAALPSPVSADSSLLYLEAQGIAGYSSATERPIYYSMNPEAEMQKPSIGFDYLRRIAGDGGDVASFALQSRLALTVDGGTKTVEPQVYNAWVKVKTPVSDIWAGHNRPAIGLGSYFDSHGLLLRTLPIQGFGYDRDWGVGSYKDLPWGNVQFSATTGSGMPVYVRGNYLLAGRVGYGVPNDDNYTVGFSAGYGRTLDTMGYTLRDPDPRRASIAGIDAALFRDGFEHRADVIAGRWLGTYTVAAMYRLGIVLDGEGRRRIELQPTYWRSGGENWLLSVCFSSLVTADLTFRVMYEYDKDAVDHRAMVQLYYYLPV